MSCCERTSFSDTFHYHNTTQPLTKLQTNLKSFIDYALLGIGAWIDVDGGNSSILKCAQAPGYDPGQVWQAFRGNIVWEEGIVYTDKLNVNRSPIIPVFSVVPDSINYRNGWIVVTPRLSTDSVVSGTFSVKCVSVLVAGEAPWWQEWETSSWDVSEWSSEDCSCWNLGNHKAYFPAIVIDGFLEKVRPSGLGPCNLIKTYNIDLHVLASTKEERDRLLDILLSDLGQCTALYDPDLAPCIMDCNGEIQNNLLFPELVKSYCWRGAQLVRAENFGNSTIDCGADAVIYEGIARHVYDIAV